MTTFTKVATLYPGDRVEILATFLFDSSYPTGGESLPLATLGLLRVDSFIADGAGGYAFQWDNTNKKVKAFSASGTEVANTTDLSAVTATCRILGV